MPGPAAGLRCPRCGAAVAAGAPWRPFCGERCKTLDLGGWLLGHYRVPAREDDDEGAAVPPPREDDDDDADR